MSQRRRASAPGARWPLAAAVLAGGAAMLVVGPFSSQPTVGASAPSGGLGGLRARLPVASTAAFTVATPKPLTQRAHLTWWAPVRSATVAREAPDHAAAAVTTVGTRTPEGTSNLVVVVGHGRVRDHVVWLEVRLATLPADRTGWVPRRALGAYHAVDTELVVDRRRRTAALLRGGREVFRARVGVGRAATPTPAGRFYVRDKLTRFRSPSYGPVAFGTSARSATLTDWPAGGFVGLHGTDQPGVLSPTAACASPTRT